MREGAALGTWLVGGLGAGVLGKRVADGGMCIFSGVLLPSSNQRADILGRSMTPTSFSTLMHYVLR